MKNLWMLFVLMLLAGCNGSLHDPFAGPTFYEKLQKVKPGETQQQVLAQLGPPDYMLAEDLVKSKNQDEWGYFIPDGLTTPSYYLFFTTDGHYTHWRTSNGGIPADGATAQAAATQNVADQLNQMKWDSRLNHGN